MSHRRSACRRAGCGGDPISHHAEHRASKVPIVLQRREHVSINTDRSRPARTSRGSASPSARPTKSPDRRPLKPETSNPEWRERRDSRCALKTPLRDALLARRSRSRWTMAPSQALRRLPPASRRPERLSGQPHRTACPSAPLWSAPGGPPVRYWGAPAAKARAARTGLKAIAPRSRIFKRHESFSAAPKDTHSLATQL